jgi:uncharacterized protein involved in copper resistance
MLTFKQFIAEAFNVWTHKEAPLDAAKKHVQDLKANGHKILGSSYGKTKMADGQEYDTARILAKDSSGKHTYHAINSLGTQDRADKRISPSANSTRVMRGATKMHMSMKGKFHPDLK